MGYGVMKKMMLVMAGFAICAVTVDAQASDFETALKNELLLQIVVNNCAYIT